MVVVFEQGLIAASLLLLLCFPLSYSIQDLVWWKEALTSFLDFLDTLVWVSLEIVKQSPLQPVVLPEVSFATLLCWYRAVLAPMVNGVRMDAQHVQIGWRCGWKSVRQCGKAQTVLRRGFLLPFSAGFVLLFVWTACSLCMQMKCSARFQGCANKQLFRVF